MSKICRESEVSIEHYQLFKSILAQVPIPICSASAESLAPSAVRTAQKVRAVQSWSDSWRIHRAARGEVQTRSSSANGVRADADDGLATWHC